MDQCPQKCNYRLVPSPGSRFHAKQFPNQQGTCPRRVTDSRRAGSGSLPDLCPVQLSENRSHQLSVTAANTFLNVKFLAASHMLSLAISWHILTHRAFSEFRGNRCTPQCRVRGAELTSIAGETDMPSNQRDLVGGENRSEGRDLWVWVSGEGKKLKKHNSLVLEHLVSHILPRVKLLCFQKFWIQKKNVYEKKSLPGKRFPRFFAWGFWKKKKKNVKREWCRCSPWNNVNLSVTYRVLSPGAFLWSASIPGDNLSCLIPLICTKLIFI